MNNPSSEIITATRRHLGLNQADFGSKILEISQSQVCKYENGNATIPGNTIILCTNILEGSSNPISADRLARRVRRELNGKQFQKARHALAAFLDSVSEGG